MVESRPIRGRLFLGLTMPPAVPSARAFSNPKDLKPRAMQGAGAARGATASCKLAVGAKRLSRVDGAAGMALGQWSWSNGAGLQQPPARPVLSAFLLPAADGRLQLQAASLPRSNPAWQSDSLAACNASVAAWQPDSLAAWQRLSRVHTRTSPHPCLHPTPHMHTRTCA